MINLTNKVSQHYSVSPQKYPEIKGDKLSSLECRTFQRFVSLYSSWMEVVDIGCGTGRVGRHLSKLLKPRIHVAFELSRKELVLAEELGSEAEKYYSVLGSVLKLPFKKIKYCVCFGVAHHTPDPDLAIREIASCMVPGGYLYLAIYSKSWYSLLYKFFAIFREAREKRINWFVNLAFYCFFLPRYFLRILESRSFRCDFNIRASFEDFVMTPYAYFFSDKELRMKFGSLGLRVIDHEVLNYGLLHCYVLEKQ